MSDHRSGHTLEDCEAGRHTGGGRRVAFGDGTVCPVCQKTVCSTGFAHEPFLTILCTLDADHAGPHENRWEAVISS